VKPNISWYKVKRETGENIDYEIKYNPM